MLCKIVDIKGICVLVRNEVLIKKSNSLLLSKTKNIAAERLIVIFG